MATAVASRASVSAAAAGRPIQAQRFVLVGPLGPVEDEQTQVTVASSSGSAAAATTTDAVTTAAAGQAAASTAVASSAGRGEGARALRNAIKLTLSLCGTLGVAFAVRFWIPRYVGAEAFGQLHFAESFAMSFFVLTALGIDTYIHKEVSARPDHAQDFLGTVMALRAFLSGAVVAAMMGVLWWMGKGALEWRLVGIFAVGQLAFVAAHTLAALLQSVGQVNGLAVINIAAKLLWGAGIFAGLIFGKALEFVALSFAVVESLKCLLLYRVVKRHMPMRLHFNWAQGKVALAASMPFFVNMLAHKLYEKVDVNMISAMVSDVEVGWYGAATNLCTIALLLTPIVQAVVMPMGARLARRSTDALNHMMQAAVQVVLVGGVLATVLLVLHGPTLVTLLFGADYAPGALGLQMLAPMFPLTYLCVLGAIHLFQLNRVWVVTCSSVVGLILNPTLNWFLIPWGHARFGDGGAGAGAALASVTTDVVIAVFLFVALGRSGLSTRLVTTLVKLALCGAAAVGVHRYLEPALWTAFAEAGVFVLLALLMRAVPVGMVRTMALAALRRRGGGRAAGSAAVASSGEG